MFGKEERTMSGADGYKNKNLIKINWEQFQTWQRWDEFPERSDNPPMTVDMTFLYMGKIYYLDGINQEYAILTDAWEVVVSDSNFLRVLCKPVEIWEGKSFKELIAEFLFEN